MITSADIRARLVEKYPFQDGWITMAEVTPPKTSRRFDLIAIMGWQSRGHEAMGFEIKVNRGDWLRELKDPAKAEPLVRLCSRWWIVAPPGVVEVSELPPAWGLLVVHPEQIRTGKQAAVLECEPWSDAVWRCMLLRCADREIERKRREPDELTQARSAGYLEGMKASEENWKKSLEQEEQRHEQTRKAIADAEKATGVRISQWMDFPALGEAMAILKNADCSRTADRLEKQAAELIEAAESMKMAATSLRPRAVPA